MCALVVLNPYGKAFYLRVLQGITMNRAMITEWSPVFKGPFAPIATLGLTITAFLYQAKP